MTPRAGHGQFTASEGHRTLTYCGRPNGTGSRVCSARLGTAIPRVIVYSANS